VGLSVPPTQYISSSEMRLGGWERGNSSGCLFGCLCASYGVRVQFGK